MAVYAALIVAASFSALVSGYHGSKVDRDFAIGLFIVMGLLSGLRGLDVGTDTLTYYNVFLSIGSHPSVLDAISSSSISAPAYVVENWLIATFGGGYRVVLIINGILTCGMTARFVLRTSKAPSFSALCFILLATFFQSMNGMRQYLAIVFAMNALVDFYGDAGGSKARALLLFVLAVLTHSTAMACLPGFFCALAFRRMSDKRKVMFAATVVSAAVSAFMLFFVNIFLQIFPYYSMYDGSTNIDVFSNDYGGRIVILYLLLLGVCIVDYAISPREPGDDSNFSRAICIFCVMAVIMGLFFSKNFLMTRLLWFYLFPFISYIPNVVTCIRGGLMVLVCEIVCVGLFVWCALQMIENKDDVIPYVLSLSDFLSYVLR